MDARGRQSRIDLAAELRAGRRRQLGQQAVGVAAGGIVEPTQLREATETVIRHHRRRLIRTVVEDVAGGAHSLGELDFARLCRRRSGRSTSFRLARRIWTASSAGAAGCVVEVDGAGHTAPADQLSDALRQNELTIGTRRVLRIPLLGLRVAETMFMAQIRRLLISAGWTG